MSCRLCGHLIGIQRKRTRFHRALQSFVKKLDQTSALGRQSLPHHRPKTESCGNKRQDRIFQVLYTLYRCVSTRSKTPQSCSFAYGSFHSTFRQVHAGPVASLHKLKIFGGRFSGTQGPLSNTVTKNTRSLNLEPERDRRLDNSFVTHNPPTNLMGYGAENSNSRFLSFFSVRLKNSVQA